MSQVTFNAADAGAFRLLGNLPPALIGALGRRFADFADHHKKSVLKDARSRFAARDRAVRMLASRIFGYGSPRNATTIGDLRGESFLASREGNDEHPLGRDYFLALETGRPINTTDAMAVPIGRGRPYRGVFANVAIWARAGGGRGSLASRGFSFVPGPNGRTLIVDERERSLSRAAREGHRGDLVVGILTRRRRQGKLLSFVDEAERIAPKHLARMERDVELAATAAGREALASRTLAAEAGSAEFRRVYREALEANPRKFAAARRAAARASREVERSLLAPRGRV